MRLVLDTSVVVAAFRSPGGASARLIELAGAGEVTMLVGTALLLEYEAVLTRTEHLAAAGVSEQSMRRALDRLVEIAAPVYHFYSWRPQLDDPDDEMVLETAINGGAAALVTFEISVFAPACGRFHIEATRPGSLVKRLKR